MDAALIVQRGGRLDVGHIVYVPGKLRLVAAVRLIHAADIHEAPVADHPGGILPALHQHLAGLALYVAHGLVDGAKIVHIGAIGHDRVGHAVGKLMGQHIQAL